MNHHSREVLIVFSIVFLLIPWFNSSIATASDGFDLVSHFECDPLGNVRDLIVQGDYAYIAAGGTGFHVLDLSDMSNIHEIGHLNLNISEFLSSGYQLLQGDQMAVQGDLAVVTGIDQKNYFIDISNPKNPTVITSCIPSIPNRQILIKDTLVIMEDDLGLSFYNISSPENPILLNQIDILSEFDDRRPFNYPNIIDLELYECYLVVLMDMYGIKVFNINDPRNINEISTLQILWDEEYYSWYATDIEIDENKAYIFCQDDSVEVYDLTDLQNIDRIGYYNIGSSIYHGTVRNDTLIACGISDSIRIIDFTNVEMPEIILTKHYNATLYQLKRYDSRLYLAFENSAITVNDCSSLSTPKEISRYSPGGLLMDIAVIGSYGYLLQENAGIRILDLHDPLTPFETGTLTKYTDPKCIEIEGDYAFVANGVDGFHIYDVSNPENPIERGDYMPGSFMAFDPQVIDVAVVDSVAYLACLTGGLVILDVSNPDSPEMISTIPPPGGQTSEVQAVSVVDGVAVLFVDDTAAFLFDVSTPQYPVELENSNLDARYIVGDGDPYVFGYGFTFHTYNLSDAGSGFPALSDLSVAPWYATDMEYADDRVLMTNGGQGFSVISVVDPLNPVIAYQSLSGFGYARGLDYENGYVYIVDSYGEATTSKTVSSGSSNSLKIYKDNSTGVDDGSQSLPKVFTIQQVYPNP
ncbi:MAG: hypothetical protein V2A56_00060, partial [bacterium]